MFFFSEISGDSPIHPCQDGVYDHDDSLTAGGAAGGERPEAGTQERARGRGEGSVAVVVRRPCCPHSFHPHLRHRSVLHHRKVSCHAEVPDWLAVPEPAFQNVFCPTGIQFSPSMGWTVERM